MSNPSTPTHQQMDALRGLIRCGTPLTAVQRGHLARLLDEIGWMMQTCAKAAQKYPQSRELQTGWLVACWGPVGDAYTELLAAVAQ